MYVQKFSDIESTDMVQSILRWWINFEDTEL